MTRVSFKFPPPFLLAQTPACPSPLPRYISRAVRAHDCLPSTKVSLSSRRMAKAHGGMVESSMRARPPLSPFLEQSVPGGDVTYPVDYLSRRAKLTPAFPLSCHFVSTSGRKSFNLIFLRSSGSRATEDSPVGCFSTLSSLESLAQSISSVSPLNR